MVVHRLLYSQHSLVWSGVAVASVLELLAWCIDDFAGEEISVTSLTIPTISVTKIQWDKALCRGQHVAIPWQAMPCVMLFFRHVIPLVKLSVVFSRWRCWGSFLAAVLLEPLHNQLNVVTSEFLCTSCVTSSNWDGVGCLQTQVYRSPQLEQSIILNATPIIGTVMIGRSQMQHLTDMVSLSFMPPTHMGCQQEGPSMMNTSLPKSDCHVGTDHLKITDRNCQQCTSHLSCDLDGWHVVTIHWCMCYSILCYVTHTCPLCKYYVHMYDNGYL